MSLKVILVIVMSIVNHHHHHHVVMTALLTDIILLVKVIVLLKVVCVLPLSSIKELNQDACAYTPANSRCHIVCSTATLLLSLNPHFILCDSFDLSITITKTFS